MKERLEQIQSVVKEVPSKPLVSDAIENGSKAVKKAGKDAAAANSGHSALDHFGIKHT